MPGTPNNSKINAKRFAALLAGFDLGNGSDEEALAKARVLRRMAAEAGMRLVDVMELPEVKQAIDEQLHPSRAENVQLREALREMEALREELTERTRDARRLADLLREREEEAAHPGQGWAPVVTASPEGGIIRPVSTRRAANYSFRADTELHAIIGTLCKIAGTLIGMYLAMR